MSVTAFTPGEPITSSSAVANGVVYAASLDGNLYAFCLADGVTAPARPNQTSLHPDRTVALLHRRWRLIYW